MRQLVKRFWHDERGSIGVEWAFIATILVLGAITGAVAVQQAALEPEDSPPVVRADR
jgi:Flp pilus assembly pilin Flp